MQLYPWTNKRLQLVAWQSFSRTTNTGMKKANIIIYFVWQSVSGSSEMKEPRFDNTTNFNDTYLYHNKL